MAFEVGPDGREGDVVSTTAAVLGDWGSDRERRRRVRTYVLLAMFIVTIATTDEHV